MMQIQKRPMDHERSGLSPELVGAALEVRRGGEPTISFVPMGTEHMSPQERDRALGSAGRKEGQLLLDARRVAGDADLEDYVKSGESRLGLSKVELGIRRMLGRMGVRDVNLQAVQVVRGLSVPEPGLKESPAEPPQIVFSEESLPPLAEPHPQNKIDTSGKE